MRFVKTEPNAQLLSDETIPRVRLAGCEWPIPPLAIRQNKHVLPLVLKWELALRGAATHDERAALVLAPERVEDFQRIVFWGLDRGHRTLTIEEFEEWPMSLGELFDAAMVVVAQTKSTQAADGARPAGETPGDSQTGTR